MKVLIVLSLAIVFVSAFGKKKPASPIYIRDLPKKTPRKFSITNGYRAYDGQFPYQVGLYMKFDFLCEGLCSGSIISNQWVLTAAHCVYNRNSVYIIYGTVDFLNPRLSIHVDSNNIWQHEDFNYSNLANDICLINTPFIAFNDYIKKIMLPPLNTRQFQFDGENAIVAGWGQTSDSSPPACNILQYANFIIMNVYTCQLYYDPGIVQSDSICVATSNGRSPCKGDSGGPLVLNRNKQQIGVMSYGSLHGCENGFPVVFTKVTSYLEWIKDISGVYY
ncbi:collagenase-like [Drosophila innubila]|uniref:collagenase-like n=1 Tax=Drosophila innubila TaxID=198719 RepID=UPI00148CB833|nr:collagenase-like [Drosophila innubila]